MVAGVDLGPVDGPTIEGALAAVSVPASTANLGPGYDAFGAALSLRTTVTALPAATRDVRVTTEAVGHAAAREHAVPAGDENLVWQGVLTACESHGWEVPDVALHVRTAVPFASGLGSSSAAIVGGLAIARLLARADGSMPPADGADRRAQEDVDRLVGDRALLRTAVAVEGHPDNVAPAIHGGVVVATPGDDGEWVVRLSPPPATTDPVLLVPARTSSTAEARTVVPDHLDRPDVVSQVGRAGHVVGAMLGVWPADARAAGDRLHEPPRAAALGPGGELLASLRRAGHHAWLSGAGPSVAVTVPAGRDVPATVLELAAAAEHAVLRLAWDRQGVRACAPYGCGVAGTRTCLDCPMGSVR